MELALRSDNVTGAASASAIERAIALPQPSGGRQQRVAIARAPVGGPEVIFAPSGPVRGEGAFNVDATPGRRSRVKVTKCWPTETVQSRRL